MGVQSAQEGLRGFCVVATVSFVLALANGSRDLRALGRILRQPGSWGPRKGELALDIRFMDCFFAVFFNNV